MSPRQPSRASASLHTPQVTALGDESEALLEEIAAIDIAFEEGLLESATYDRVRAAAKERLAAMTRDTRSS